MKIRKKAKVYEGCVACGNCEKHCPLGAIAVYKGIHAEVDEDKCKGCGKCAVACPADVVACEAEEAVSA